MFYVLLAVLISATCFAGFSFTYFRPLANGTYPQTGAALHVHGWSFFLWYLLLPLQATLIARAKRRVHVALGRLSVLLVAVMASSGILVLSIRVEDAVRTNGDPVWLLYGPLILSNLVLFLVFYVAGIRMASTKRIQSHKRLILVASAIGLGAGFFRLVLFLSGFHPLSLPGGVLACSLFIVLGAVYDRVTRGRVHRVYWVGLVTMLTIEGALLPQVNPSGVAAVTRVIAKTGQYLKTFYDPEPTVQFSEVQGQSL